MFHKETGNYCEVLLAPLAARLNVSLQPSAISCWWSRVIYLNIGRQSSDFSIRTAVCNMEILLFNKPGTESANNNYLCTLQIPLLLIWKDEICNKSMFKLFLIQTSTSTRQKHFCMNGNQKMLDVRRCKAAMFNWECSGPRHLINQSWKHWKQPSCQHRKLLTLHIPECKIAVSFVLSVRPYI